MIFKEEIPFLYRNNFHSMKLYQDKTTSHTSKSTFTFLEKMKIDTSNGNMPFQHILVKSSDVSPIDYCVFGLLKRIFSKQQPTTIDALCENAEEKWKVMPLEILRKVVLSRISRCILVVQKQGYQTENFKNSFYILNIN